MYNTIKCPSCKNNIYYNDNDTHVSCSHCHTLTDIKLIKDMETCMKKEREIWIKSLKKGDKVANEVYNRFNGKYYEFLEVKNITPKGNIRLTNNILLDSNGYYYKYIQYGGSKEYKIIPITKEIVSFEKNRKEYNKIFNDVSKLCDNFCRKNYTIEDLELLKEILERGK